ncbi:helix-turn-helix transcriptional regulator [Bartonella sp. AU15XJBT]|uniref:helix-turn-helix transcriptional regulator n=1 Tax=Bartonella sp. AU15XJBT TaxID=3019087 RepID=UPI00236106FE|nr:helix-turn-helix transcriptional regulator [Bartonella sp. AU15XJBT]
MLTPFGKTLRKIRLDRTERLLDMADKLGVSIAFLSSVEIGKKPIPADMEEKIIEKYALDEETASILRREANICRKNFTMNSSAPLNHEISNTFVRMFKSLSQQDLTKCKELMEKVEKKRCLQNRIP